MGSGPLMHPPTLDHPGRKPRPLKRPRKPVRPTGPKIRRDRAGGAPAADLADRDAPNPNDPHVSMT